MLYKAEFEAVLAADLDTEIIGITHKINELSLTKETIIISAIDVQVIGVLKGRVILIGLAILKLKAVVTRENKKLDYLLFKIVTRILSAKNKRFFNEAKGIKK